MKARFRQEFKLEKVEPEQVFHEDMIHHRMSVDVTKMLKDKFPLDIKEDDTTIKYRREFYVFSKEELLQFVKDYNENKVTLP
jgi:hypothetical protein